MYKVKISVPESYRFEFNKIYESVCKENNIQMKLVDSSAGKVPDTTKRVGAPNKISYPVKAAQINYKPVVKRGLFGIKRHVIEEEVVKVPVGDIYEIHNMKIYLKVNSLYDIQTAVDALFSDDFCEGSDIDLFVESVSVA